MADIRKVYYLPHSDIMREIHRDNHRFRVLDFGRRAGKTTMAVAEAWQMCLDVRKKHNRKARGWWIAPTYSLAQEAVRIFKEILKDVILTINDRHCVFIDGSEVEFKSADNKDENLRGAGLDFAILDEAARIHLDVWELGVRPALSDKLGRALFLSTPKGRNWFFDKFVLGQNDSEWKSWKLPTTINPYFPVQEWDTLKKTTPEHIFKQEFEAEFLEDSSSVFRKIRQCIKGELEDPIPGEEYVIGVDLAKTVDFTVLIVMKKSTGHVVAFERFNQIDWTLQKEKIKFLVNKYSITSKAIVYIDSTGVGDPIVSDLNRAGCSANGLVLSNDSKQELIELAVICIEQGMISFPHVPDLINELMAFEYEVLPSGRIRYGAPAGLHDDCVISLCLALHPLRNSLYYKAARKEKPVDNLSNEQRAINNQLRQGLKLPQVQSIREEIISF